MSPIRPILHLVSALLAAHVLAGCSATGSQAPLAEASEDASTLLARADEHLDNRGFDNARRTYELAAMAASAEGNEALYVEAASQVALVQVLTGQVAGGREWLDSATARLDRDEPRAWVRWLMARGAYEREDGKIARALATFEEAFDFARATGQPVRAVQAAQWATVVADGLQSVRWCRRAIEAASDVPQPALQAALWGQLARVLSERGLHDDALTAFERARQLTPAKDEHSILVADWSRARELRLSGRLSDAREAMEEVSARASRRYLARRGPNDAEWMGHCQSELGELSLAAGDLKRALARFGLARERLLEAGARRLAPERLDAIDQKLDEVRSALSAEG